MSFAKLCIAEASMMQFISVFKSCCISIWVNHSYAEGADFDENGEVYPEGYNGPFQRSSSYPFSFCICPSVASYLQFLKKPVFICVNLCLRTCK